MFEVQNVNDLCRAARMLGNGSATEDAISTLIHSAKNQEPSTLLRGLIAGARASAEKYKEPALRLERLARIAGLTGEDKDFKHAIGLVSKVSHPCARARAKKFIVQAYLAAGEIEEARHYAKIIISAFWSAEAWIEITNKSGDMEDFKCAKARASLIADPLAKEEVDAQINALKQLFP